MRSRAPFIVICGLLACGGTPHESSAPAAPIAQIPDAAQARAPETDDEPSAPTRVLDIDWTTIQIASDADALALWRRIAPTGDDWQLKLGEIPVDLAGPLSVGLLRGGNFTCMAPVAKAPCAPLRFDVDPPAATATFDDPCLRRLLALWALNQLDDSDIPSVTDALRGIVTIPPPESELVATAIGILPEAEQNLRLELIASAYAAGQRDVANHQLGSLDEGRLVTAVTKHHIDGVIEILSAKGYRAVFLAAVVDEKLAAKARVDAIGELATEDVKLQPDARAALVAAARSRNCEVAAAAARALEKLGDKRFVPVPPRGTSLPPMMHALCVLAHYERLQSSDEDSLLAAFVPAKGLELITVAYDPLSEEDTDGDGDPRTQRSVLLIPRADVSIPEVDDVARSFDDCNGTVCRTHDRDVRFTFAPAGGALRLARIELVDHPPCPVSR